MRRDEKERRDNRDKKRGRAVPESEGGGSLTERPITWGLTPSFSSDAVIND